MAIFIFSKEFNLGCVGRLVLTKYQDLQVIQLFHESYCKTYDLDYSVFTNLDPYSIYENLYSLESLVTSYKERVYDQITEFILKIKKWYKNVRVLIGDSNSKSALELNKFHFTYLYKEFEKNCISYHDISVDTVQREESFDVVIVVELITDQITFEKTCQNIISRYYRCSPVVCYISLAKEYITEEMEVIIQSKTMELEYNVEKYLTEEVNCSRNEYTEFVEDEGDLYDLKKSRFIL